MMTVSTPWADIVLTGLRDRMRGEAIDGYPWVVARVADIADVIACVDFAHDHQIPPAVRGGGHHGAGSGAADGALVIDFSRLRSTTDDPPARTVRVDAGCTWGDVDHATGAFVTASAESHPDLFWALRGGGFAFPRAAVGAEGAGSSGAIPGRAPPVWREHPDTANLATITDWAQRCWEDLHPTSVGSGYVHMMMDEGQERVRAAYRGNYERHVQVKRRYDPHNLSRFNQNIAP